jgi:hypothetical protein
VSETRITKRSDETRWTKLYQQWISEKKPGQVIEAGGQGWRVIQDAEFPDAKGAEDEVAFIPVTGFDSHYAGTTKGLSS